MTIYPTRPLPTISTCYISSWLFDRLVVFLISSRRLFTCFTNKQHIKYITESGRTTNKQERTWISSKRKDVVAFALFWYCVAIASVYPNENPTQLPETLTHPLALADLASGSTGPNSAIQQPLSSDRRPSLTFNDSYWLPWDLDVSCLLPVS